MAGTSLHLPCPIPNSYCPSKVLYTKHCGAFNTYASLEMQVPMNGQQGRLNFGCKIYVLGTWELALAMLKSLWHSFCSSVRSIGALWKLLIAPLRHYMSKKPSSLQSYSMTHLKLPDLLRAEQYTSRIIFTAQKRTYPYILETQV